MPGAVCYRGRKRVLLAHRELPLETKAKRKAYRKGYMVGFEEFPLFSESHSSRTRSVFTHCDVTLYPNSMKLECFIANVLVNKRFGRSLIERFIGKSTCFKNFVNSGIQILKNREQRRLGALDGELDKSAKHINWITKKMHELQGTRPKLSKQQEAVYLAAPYKPISNNSETFGSSEIIVAINLLENCVLPSWEKHYKSIEKRKVKMNETLDNIQKYVKSHELTDIL